MKVNFIPLIISLVIGAIILFVLKKLSLISSYSDYLPLAIMLIAIILGIVIGLRRKKDYTSEVTESRMLIKKY